MHYSGRWCQSLGVQGVVFALSYFGRKSPASFLPRVDSCLLMMRQKYIHFQPIRVILAFSFLADFGLVSLRPI